MRKFLLIVGLLMLATVLIACGNNGNDDADGTNDDDISVDVKAAEALYKDSCASCHGGDLEGDFGPSLETVGNDMSEDEIRETIKEGGEKMPAESLRGEDADKVAAWLATKK